MRVRVVKGRILDGRRHHGVGDVLDVRDDVAARLIRDGVVEPLADPAHDWSLSTKRELREELDRRGVAYTARDNKAALLALLGGE